MVKYEHEGIFYTIVELSNMTRLSKHRILRRINVYGWSVKRAVETPDNEKYGQLYKYKNESYSVQELSELSGLLPQTLISRLKSGWPIEKAVEKPSTRQIKPIELPRKKIIIPRTMFEYNGLIYSLRELSILAQLSIETIYRRIFKYKWSVNRSVETLENREYGTLYQYKNKLLTIRELSELSGLEQQIIRLRIKSGWPIEKATEKPSQQIKQRPQRKWSNRSKREKSN